MEHRLEDRVVAPIDVAIHTIQHETYETRLCNLSMGGAQIQIDPSWEIRNKNLVVIEFMEKVLSVKIPALVIWTSTISASLMFMERFSELNSYLRLEKLY